jgi:hypothetical protein
MLLSCSSAQHQNTAHPDYGEAQYRADLAECRRQNSTVEMTQGYDMQSRVTTNEAKVAACMTGRGWRTADR